MTLPLHFKTYLTDRLQIKYPIIGAPMFLVSNAAMLRSFDQAGCIGCMPALNIKTLDELSQKMAELDQSKVRYGINLIVSTSNPYWQQQLEVITATHCSFIITSLGNPQPVIDKCRPKNIAVFCDVIDLHFAQKVASMKPDALIAVNSGAGGHLGKIPMSLLVPMLKRDFDLPIISAGGVANGQGLLSALALGAEGVSLGSIFLATQESPINPEYKNACIQYGAQDIAVSTKISGTPCTVINTPYVKKIGLQQNWLEKFLSKHRKLKRYIRMLTYYKGTKLLEKAAFQATYQTVWCAGPSIEFSEKLNTIPGIVEELVQQAHYAQTELKKKLQ